MPRVKIGNFKGPKGDIGLTGPKGDTGAAGPTGATGAIGPQGLKGNTGPQGPEGLPGPEGPQGLKGDPGATGPQGFKGDTGDPGPRGIQGLKGDTGDIGPAGAKGDIGPQGLRGIQGLQGIQGVKGDTGPIGPQGIKGDTGAVGPKGDTGDRGLIGATGPIGPQGPQGIKGDTGSTGATGSIGPQGPKGDKGDKGDPNNILVPEPASASTSPNNFPAGGSYFAFTNGIAKGYPFNVGMAITTKDTYYVTQEAVEVSPDGGHSRYTRSWRSDTNWSPFKEYMSQDSAKFNMRTLPLLNGATAFAGRTPKITKVSGMVTMQGAIDPQTGIVANLPAGYRPAEAQIFATAQQTGNAPPKVALIYVTSDGNINVLNMDDSVRGVGLNGTFIAEN